MPVRVNSSLIELQIPCHLIKAAGHVCVGTFRLVLNFLWKYEKPEGGKANFWKRTELEGTVLISGHNLSFRIRGSVSRCKHRC